MRPRWIAAATVVATLTLSPAVEAQSRLDEISDADKAAARTLVDAGDAKFKSGDYEGALADYRGADTIMMVPTTGIEVARTLVVLERLLEARAVFERIARYPEAAEEPAAFTRARERAETRLEELQERIPTLVVRIAEEKGVAMTISIDGSPAEQGVPVPLDPGDHTAEVSAPGHIGSSKSIHLDERGRREVVLTLTKPPPAPVPGPAVVPAPVSAPAPSVWPTVGYVSLGIGGAAAIVGVITGAVSLSKASSFDDQQREDGTYPTSAGPLRDDSVTLAHASTASFVIAGLAGLGGVLALTLGDDEDVRVGLGPHGLSVRGSF